MKSIVDYTTGITNYLGTAAEKTATTQHRQFDTFTVVDAASLMVIANYISDGTSWYRVADDAPSAASTGFLTSYYAAAQTDRELIPAPGAGLSIYVTDIIISNGATAGVVLLEEDTASAKTAKLQSLYLPINGVIHIKLTTPIKLTAAKNFGWTSTTVTTHTVSAGYYIAA